MELQDHSSCTAAMQLQNPQQRQTFSLIIFYAKNFDFFEKYKCNSVSKETKSVIRTWGWAPYILTPRKLIKARGLWSEDRLSKCLFRVFLLFDAVIMP
jgi:hypothetical protein